MSVYGSLHANSTVGTTWLSRAVGWNSCVRRVLWLWVLLKVKNRDDNPVDLLFIVGYIEGVFRLFSFGIGSNIFPPWRCWRLVQFPVRTSGRLESNLIPRPISETSLFLFLDWFFSLLLNELYITPHWWHCAGSFHEEVFIGAQCT